MEITTRKEGKIENWAERENDEKRRVETMRKERERENDAELKNPKRENLERKRNYYRMGEEKRNGGT